MQAKTTNIGQVFNKRKRKETQEKDLPKPKRHRIEETPLELLEVKEIPHLRNRSSFSFYHFASKKVYIFTIQYCSPLFKYSVNYWLFLFYLHFCVLFTL